MKWALIMSGYNLVAYQWNFKEKGGQSKKRVAIFTESRGGEEEGQREGK